MTFSISAVCPKTGQFGVAVTSSSLCVAARCAFARAHYGAVATQNITDPRLAPRILDLLASGYQAQEALDSVMSAHARREFRQLAVVDRYGNTATHSGAKTLGTNAIATAHGVAAAGNLLSHAGVPQAMVDGFVSTDGEPLGNRLIAGMLAGLQSGGEMGPVASAGMVIADKEQWYVADLRVDKSETPIEDLEVLWKAWEPEMYDYVTRGINPETAPSYGVPGDE
jgi:uncharacterized Ntn-hydrolase superfamily protein